MVASKQDLSIFQVGGEPYDIGYRLGELARPVFTDYMNQSGAWAAVRRWRGAALVKALRAAAHAHFPALLAELDGMAAGLGWPAEDVFLWNCRGELIHNAHDPDDENTLATALFGIGSAGVSMKIYRQGQCAFHTFMPARHLSKPAFKRLPQPQETEHHVHRFSSFAQASAAGRRRG
jgi:hypothetical protein